jgi:peptidoglycan/LPS O-acetylase OafA/YrhL
MLHHGFLFASSGSGAGRLWLSFTNSCWVGVDLFFVLSGFLITGILLRSRDDKSYFFTFYMRRVFRIFPLYFAYLACLAVLAIAFHPDGLGVLALPWTVSYLANVDTALNGWPWTPIAGLWSLSVEEQFYAVWPMLLRLLPRRAILGSICGLAFAFPLVRVFLAERGPDGTTYTYTLLHLDGLLIGAVFAIVRTRLATHPWTPFLARIFALSSTLALVALAAWRGVHWQEFYRFRSFGYTVIALWGVSLIAVSIYSGAGSSINSILRIRVLQTLGKYSYALYLFHGTVLYGMDLYRPLPDSIALHALYLAISAAIALGLAWVSWNILERPCLALKERRFPTGASALEVR